MDTSLSTTSTLPLSAADRDTTGTKRRSHPLTLPVALILVGLLILAYPVVSTLWNNHRQVESAKRYTEIVQQIDPSARLEQLRRAQEYNATYPQGPLLDPWLSRVAPDNIDYRRYLDVLNASDTMGRIKIPDIDVDLPIYHGSTEDVLSKGVGHLYGTSFPVGGDGTHAVLTGHTGLANATLFDHLHDMEKGDSFYIDVLGQRLKYEVHSIEVVLPSETEGLAPVPGKDLVTLITCTPYGINSHRLLVTGHRVPLDDDEAEDVFNKTASVWTWWMKLVATIVALIALGLLLWLLGLRKRGKDDDDPNASDPIKPTNAADNDAAADAASGVDAQGFDTTNSDSTDE